MFGDATCGVVTDERQEAYDRDPEVAAQQFVGDGEREQGARHLYERRTRLMREQRT